MVGIVLWSLVGNYEANFRNEMQLQQQLAVHNQELQAAGAATLCRAFLLPAVAHVATDEGEALKQAMVNFDVPLGAVCCDALIARLAPS